MESTDAALVFRVSRLLYVPAARSWDEFFKELLTQIIAGLSRRGDQLLDP
jgi:hypothetical protein